MRVCGNRLEEWDSQRQEKAPPIPAKVEAQAETLQIEVQAGNLQETGATDKAGLCHLCRSRSISPKMFFYVIWSGRLCQKVVPKVQSCEIVKGSQDGKEFRQGEIICKVWFFYPIQNFWGPSLMTQRTLHHRRAPRWASGHSIGEMWRLDQEASLPPPTLQGKNLLTNISQIHNREWSAKIAESRISKSSDSVSSLSSLYKVNQLPR